MNGSMALHAADVNSLIVKWLHSVLKSAVIPPRYDLRIWLLNIRWRLTQYGMPMPDRKLGDAAITVSGAPACIFTIHDVVRFWRDVFSTFKRIKQRCFRAVAAAVASDLSGSDAARG